MLKVNTFYYCNQEYIAFIQQGGKSTKKIIKNDIVFVTKISVDRNIALVDIFFEDVLYTNIMWDVERLNYLTEIF